MKINKVAVLAVAGLALFGSDLWAWPWGKKDGKIKDSITVISREAGSGTRGAFVELFGVEAKNAQGKKVDMTVDSADITNSTEVVITSVSGNPSSIGYISLGSLNSTVKALEIDGAVASVANIKNGLELSNAWKSSVDTFSKASPLTNQDCRTIKEFSNSLGSSDIGGQIRNCEAYSEILKQSICNLKKSTDNSVKIINTLSLFLAAFVIIFFI